MTSSERIALLKFLQENFEREREQARRTEDRVSAYHGGARNAYNRIIWFVKNGAIPGVDIPEEE